MDRNVYIILQKTHIVNVALRKESVDRNITLSPFHDFSKVALRKESVDRNFLVDVSLDYKEVVALRKESVDRNIMSSIDVMAVSGRSPQGERG